MSNGLGEIISSAKELVSDPACTGTLATPLAKSQMKCKAIARTEIRTGRHFHVIRRLPTQRVYKKSTRRRQNCANFGSPFRLPTFDHNRIACLSEKPIVAFRQWLKSVR